LQAERNQRVKIDSDWVLRRLQAELEADASDLFADDGTLKPVHEWPEIWRKGMVSAVRVVQLYEKDSTGRNVAVGVMKDVQFADRTRKIELLGKHVAIGAFKERIALGADDPLKILFSQIAGTAIRPQAEKRTIEHQPAHEPEGEG
jgi:phage terminase small subunit